MRAIISVSDKTGLGEFSRGLAALGVEIFSTGGTLKALEREQVAARSISDLTGFPEILEGRVKTLHPAVHGGILHRRSRPDDVAQIAQHSIAAIDLVVVNLYPFRETIARPDVGLQDALEQIDIGGPTMIRAAAKNFPDVLVVVEPADYPRILAALQQDAVDLTLRRALAAKAFAHTAAYDSAIAAYLTVEQFPATLPLAWHKAYDLRYGENPHQPAAFYRADADTSGTIAAATPLQGKELSFNNLLDADAAWQIVQSFAAPTVTIIKHSNPCGLASDGDLVAAHAAARSGDPVSAFGGIVGINRPVDGRLAAAMQRYFYEVIIAPAFDDEARAIFASKTNLRLLELAMRPQHGTLWDYRQVSGGLLAQARDNVADDDPTGWRVVSERQPTPEQLAALVFAWKACAFVKSNAIVLVQGETLVGMGAGQPSRVDSVQIAARKAGERAQGSVLASDAFFPKADGVEAAAAAGAVAIVQPGGSQADDEVIATANRLGLVMVFTGRRHFKH
ncbi:MAG TPA: bifunctional phosphoribosylaminoimidazolecarboxamide formyltransferase/IMP cyclohydrolase [Herpetosiphonaceae bacterium]